MQTIKIQEALDMAKANPNGEFANSLRATIESGSIDKVAFEQGVDLTKYGRPSYEPETQRITGNVFKRGVEQLQDIPQDIQKTGQNIASTFKRGQERIGEIQDRTISGEQSLASGAFQTIGQGLSTGAGIIGDLFIGGASLATTPAEEQAIQDKLVDAVEGIKGINFSGTPLESISGSGTVGEGIQLLAEQYNTFKQSNPEIAGNLEASLGFAEAVLEVTGAGAGLKAAKKGGQRAASAVEDVTSDIASQFRKVKESTFDSKPLNTIEEALKDTSTGITPENANIGQKAVSQEGLLSVRDKRRLLEIDPETGNKYIDALEASELDDRAKPIFEVATEDTQSVFNEFENINRATGSKIGEIKQKINSTPVQQEKVQEIINGLDETLAKKGLRKNNIGQYELVKGSNSPFSATDVKNINEEVVQVLENIRNAKTNEQLVLGMESLSNKINYNLDTSISGSLQGLSKKTNAQLKEIRDSLLTKSEADEFAKYSQAKELIDEFKKSDNKIKTLINREDSMRAGDLQRVAETLKEATGKDIRDYTRLMKILIEATPSTGVNRSLLAQRIGEGAQAGAELVTGRPIGALQSILRSAGKQFLDVDKLKQVKKAIDFVPNRKSGNVNNVPKNTSVNKSSSIIDDTFLNTDKVVKDLGKRIKDTPNKQGGFVKTGLGLGKADDLVEQAKKFDNVDEFVGSKTKINHYTNKDFEKFDDAFTEDGHSFWFTDAEDINNVKLGSSVSDNKPTIKKERFIDNEKIISIEDKIEGIYVDEIDDLEIERMGYEAIKIPQDDGSNWYKVIVNPENSNIKTKKQLAEIFNKAKNTQ